MGRINTGGAKKRTGDNIALASSVSGTTLKLNPPKGYYDGVTGTVNITDADFVASKILTGTNLFGINGSLVPRELVAGEIVNESNNADITNNTNVDTVAKTFTANISGTLRIKWTHFSQDATAMWSSIYKNGSKITSDYANSGTINNVYDATVSNGDVITIRHRVSTPAGGRISHITNTSICLNSTKLVTSIT